MNEHSLIAKKNRICTDNRVVRATQIPSQVRGLNRLRYSALELIRLLSLIRDCSQARTPDYPPIVPSRAIRVARDVTRDGCSYGPSISRSRFERDCGLPAVASIRACNYRNVRNDNEEWLYPPVATNYMRGVQRNVEGSPARANALQQQNRYSFWPFHFFNSSCSVEYTDDNYMLHWR